MKIRNILKAFFFHKEEPVELDLSAAEIREGKAYLHPKNEQGVTYLVRSNDIEISLSKGLSLSSGDIIKIEPKSKKKTPEDDGKKSRKRRIPKSVKLLVMVNLLRLFQTANLTNTRSASLLFLSTRRSTTL